MRIKSLKYRNAWRTVNLEIKSKARFGQFSSSSITKILALEKGKREWAVSTTSKAGGAEPGSPGDQGGDAPRPGMRHSEAEAQAKSGENPGREPEAKRRQKSRQSESLRLRELGPRHSPVMLPVWVLIDRTAPALSRFCICPSSFIPNLEASAAQNTSHCKA